MKKALYLADKYLHLLDIDAVLAALCLSLWAHRRSGLQPVFIELTLLALAVWVVYTLDHLQPGVALRHHFHARYRKWFLWGIGLSIAAAFWLSQLIDVRVRLWGMVMVAASSLYFLVFVVSWCWRENPGKEPAIAVLFVAGCWLPVLVRGCCFLPALLAHLGLVLSNLLLCEWLESGQSAGYLGAVLWISAALAVWMGSWATLAIAIAYLAARYTALPLTRRWADRFFWTMMLE